MSGEQRVPVLTDSDVVRARQLARDTAVACGFGLVTQTKLVTATSELARNALVHGGGGEVVLDVLHEPGSTGVRVVVRDDGPGIPDVDRAMGEGWTSGGGLGLGLPGARRLVHDFTITTAARPDGADGAGGAGRGGRGGRTGTTVTVVVWDPPR